MSKPKGIKVRQVEWKGKPALLLKGASDEEVLKETLEWLHGVMAQLGLTHCGQVERFRQWPAQWGGVHIDRNKSRSLTGSFEARLIT